MSQFVRKVYFQNENGARIDCLLRTSFFNDLQGLGYADRVNYFTYANGFYSPIKRETQQNTISGKLSFLNRDNAYKDYRTLTDWISSAERQRKNGSITLIYEPYRNNANTPLEYAKDVIFAEISKGELDVGGFLTCNVSLVSLTPWYSMTPTTYSFTGSGSADGFKIYTYDYPYQYETPNQFNRTVNLGGDMDARVLIVMTGNFDGLVISLYDPDGNLKGMLDLSQSGYSVRTGETLVYSTMPDDTGIWIEDSNGVRTDIIEHIAFHDGVEVFFTIPPAENYQVRIRSSSGSSTIVGTIKAYSYWKTR